MQGTTQQQRFPFNKWLYVVSLVLGLLIGTASDLIFQSQIPTAEAQSCILAGSWCGMGHAKIGGSGSSYTASDTIPCLGHDPAVDCPGGYTCAMHAADRRKDGDTGGYFTCVLN